MNNIILQFDVYRANVTSFQKTTRTPDVEVSVEPTLYQLSRN
jgi:hypothetical protein